FREDLGAQRAGDDLRLLIRNTREGVVIRDYFVPGTVQPAQDWRVETSAGNYEFLQTLIGTLAELIDDFRVRAKAFYASALSAAGYAPQADGSYIREDITEGKFFSSHTVRTVTFGDALFIDDAGNIGRRSVPVEITGDDTTST